MIDGKIFRGLTMLMLVIVVTTQLQLVPTAEATQIRFLTGPSEGDPFEIAISYIHNHREELGLNTTDLADYVVTDQYQSRHNGVTHIYLRQRHQGIEVFNGMLSINVTNKGEIINLDNDFVSDLANRVKTSNPVILPQTAVASAAADLGIRLKAEVVVLRDMGGPDRAFELSDGGISHDVIPIKLMYQPVEEGSVRLVWDLVIRRVDSPDWWDIRVDAASGEVISKNNWTNRLSSYQIIPLPPFSDPEDSVGQTVVLDPDDPTASPFGWHDTDGAVGAESTLTRGTNVNAQEDVDANNTGGFSPEGGASLDFLFSFDPGLPPDGGTNQEAAIVNLFYATNTVHDIFYQYGFDEASGNFQVNNYGNGGAGNDPVEADAQDGSGINDATFATPPDGTEARMQMFRWNASVPDRDGALANEIIVHEYGHGISNRLTGGPSTVSCLSGTEQPGEGWSDFLSLVLTAKPTDTPTQSRGIGTYLLNEPPDGPGLRNFPYTTDLKVNPQTYEDIGSTDIPNGVGEVWANMLWRVYWNLVDKHGFDSDLYNGTGGNNRMLQLVLDGMKIQGCNPNFVNARDAILVADLINYGGEDLFEIWNGFAALGLGEFAVAGSINVGDEVENFTVPANVCNDLKNRLKDRQRLEPMGFEASTSCAFFNTFQTASTGFTNVRVRITLDPNFILDNISGAVSCCPGPGPGEHDCTLVNINSGMPKSELTITGCVIDDLLDITHSIDLVSSTPADPNSDNDTDSLTVLSTNYGDNAACSPKVLSAIFSDGFECGNTSVWTSTSK